jgi:gp32 DNA binding protein like
MSFSKLKSNSGNIERLTKEINKLNSPAEGKKGDERFWQPALDKAGNGTAIIRFLPVSSMDGEDKLPWIRLFNHGFKGPTGKWYIENSLTTLNQKDPVSELNSQLWNATSDDNSPQRKQAREQKRRLSYISNIYVLSDAKNPENEGKVFLFKYGKKIFDKISECMFPPFDEEGRSQDHPKYDPTNAFDPFDLWKGANFKLRIRTQDGYRNYDASSFDTPAPLKKDDAALEAIWNKQYSLQEFLSPSNFKSYEELKAKLNSVLELGVVSAPAAPRQASATKSMVENDVDESPFIEDEDDELKQFKALAQG